MTDIYKLFAEDMWKPSDYTDCFWYEHTWGISWSEGGEESQDPDEWEGGGYSSDRVRYKVVRDGYMIVDMHDDCGGQYQAIFSLSKKLEE